MDGNFKVKYHFHFVLANSKVVGQTPKFGVSTKTFCCFLSLFFPL